MSESEQVDSFAALFPGGPPGELQREARKARIKAERRTQLTEKQRKRGGNAVRTTQINFRCSPAFRRARGGDGQAPGVLDCRRDGGGARHAGQWEGLQEGVGG